MAGTIKYVDLSDAARAAIASLQPTAFMSFLSNYNYRPSFHISPSPNAVTASAFITVSAVATIICYSNHFSIGCSASRRNYDDNYEIFSHISLYSIYRSSIAVVCYYQCYIQCMLSILRPVGIIKVLLWVDL